MNLVELWQSDHARITAKRVDQLIAFAGEGQLRDKNSTSTEFRSLLRVVRSSVLERWIDECLEDKFTDFGFVLQDVVNEIGRRLDFDVQDGVYRGKSDEGADGLWRLADGRVLIVESKSSAAYQISLSRIAEYRSHVAPRLNISPEDVSILIVIGAQETSELESQVRGSRFAWNIRLLGVRSLLKMLKLKEQLDDAATAKQIQDILFPAEFTRLDRIVDLVFQTARDLQDTPIEKEATDVGPEQVAEEIATPATHFHDAAIARVEKHLGLSLVKRNRAIWSSTDQSLMVSCQVSREYKSPRVHYWFGMTPSIIRKLESSETAYCAFGLGDESSVVLVPLSIVREVVATCSFTRNSEGSPSQWHIFFDRRGEQVHLQKNRRTDSIDVTSMLVK